ncbi:MAG: TrkA C-terminal domain-containing protein, partial [Candidatus Thermoplasmatota archaeon]|nr:TrkA C-terminal domain-containing protein [Candidatus Thermoplasmatota archaeon]
AMDDESNAFVCLSAKGLKKDLRIVSIAEKTENIKTLHIAGATRVINSKTLAGTILGRRACHEHTLEAPGKFAMFGDLEVRQYAISSTSRIANRSIAESFIHSRSGAIVIGLWKEGNLILNPLPSEVLDEGTTILVMGTKRQLDLLYSFSGGWK